MAPGKTPLPGQVLRGLGSYKNGSVTLPMKVSVSISCEGTERLRVAMSGSRRGGTLSRGGGRQGVRPGEVSTLATPPPDPATTIPPTPASYPFACSPCPFQLAELIPTPLALVTLMSVKEEPKEKAPREKKAHPWAPPPQHNFLRNWQRHIALRKKQQEALSGEHSGQDSLPGLGHHQGSAAAFSCGSTWPKPGCSLVTLCPPPPPPPSASCF